MEFQLFANLQFEIHEHLLTYHFGIYQLCILKQRWLISSALPSTVGDGATAEVF